MEIKVYDNQVEKALKVLKRQMAKEGLLKELKKRQAYEKPSVRRKKKQAEAREKGLKRSAAERPESPRISSLRAAILLRRPVQATPACHLNADQSRASYHIPSERRF